MLIDQSLMDRWHLSPWREAISVVADRDCTKAQFLKMLGNLYENGKEIVVSDTHRGRAELLDFRGIDLSQRDLQGVDFYKMDLRGARFSGSTISDTCFETAQIEGVDFSGSFAESQARFSGSFAKNAVFQRCRFKDSIFSGVDFSSAILSEATFENCDFSGAILLHVSTDDLRMIDCNVQGAKISIKDKTANWFRAAKLVNLEQIIWIA